MADHGTTTTTNISKLEAEKLIEQLKELTTTYNDIFVEYKKETTSLKENLQDKYSALTTLEENIKDAIERLKDVKFSEEVRKSYIRSNKYDYEEFCVYENGIREEEIKLAIEKKIDSSLIEKPFQHMLYWFSGITVFLVIAMMVFFKSYYTQTETFNEAKIRNGDYMAVKYTQQRFLDLENKLNRCEVQNGKNK